jgi:ELWxxDGT repeat protein
MDAPRLVKDIVPGRSSSYPSSLGAFGNTLFFSARDDVSGRELWKSDGTAAGTVLVADIDPGISGSYPYSLTAVGDTLFFSADDLINGTELWKTDGTTAGTVLVADINPGGASSGPWQLTAVGDTLFFSAWDAVSGFELWKSDGTAAGTVRVADINPGGTSSYPDNLTAVGNTLFFIAEDGNGSARDLWKSDGTAAGTVRVAGFITEGIDELDNLTAVGDTLFFSANDNVNGRELWKSDGTAAGTVLVDDINPGIYGSYADYLTAVGDTLFFSAFNFDSGVELWKSDGTAAGTVRVADIIPGDISSDPRELTAVGNTLFFSAETGLNSRELWKSDGTAAGTMRVAGIDPDSLTAAGNTLFFSASDFVNGVELWALNVNDDVPPSLPSLAIAPLSADSPEGNDASTPFTFRVTRSGDLTGESRARWKVTGTGANPANADDFAKGRFPSGPIRFLAGQSTRTITIRVAADTIFEPDEQFAISLFNPTGASIDPGFATANGTIRNDDAPPLPELAIARGSAVKVEGSAGSTPFTFTVTRTGDSSQASSARWAVTGAGAKPADAADFPRGVFPKGTVRFAAGDTTSTITVNVRADRGQELDESFAITLTNPSGATIRTARATGIIRNDDLIGTSAADTIVGTRRPEFIDGLANQDTLTGGAGPDVFGFRFGQSRIRTPDRITDFRFGQDKIALLNGRGQLLAAPLAFSRAANNSTATSLAALADAVFADANGRAAGNQPLAANAAALVRSTNAAIAGTYLLINDGTAGRSFTADLMVNITGYSGTLPALGVRPVGSVFG